MVILSIALRKNNANWIKTLTEIASSSFLEHLTKNLPKKPWCTDMKGTALLVRPKALAINYDYIQLNSPYYQKYLILDLDYEHSRKQRFGV